MRISEDSNTESLIFRISITVMCLLVSTNSRAELSDATMDMLLKASGAEVQINAIPDAMRAFSAGVITQNDSIN